MIKYFKTKTKQKLDDITKESYDLYWTEFKKHVSLERAPASALNKFGSIIF